LRLSRLLPPSVLGTALNFVLLLVVIAGRGPLVALVAASLVSLTVQYAWTARRSLAHLGVPVRPTRAHWGFLLRETWPLALSTTLATGLQQAPILALSLVSLEATGLFNAASRIPMQLLLLPLAVRATTFPLLSASWVSDRAAFRRQLGRLVCLAILISVPVALVGIALAHPLMQVLFGAAFDAAALPFALLLGVFAVMFPGILVGEALIAAGLQRLSLLLQTASLPLLLALLVLLIPAHGAAGAALALLCTYAALVACAFIVAWSKLGGSAPSPETGEGRPVVLDAARPAAGSSSQAPAAKVALVYPIPYGEDGVFGGGERYALELATAMARRTETVLVTTGKERRSLHRGALAVEVYPWITLLRGLRQNPLALGFLESLRRVDVIHCLSYHTVLTDLSLLFARLTGKRAFITDVGGGGDLTLARLFDVTRLAHSMLLISQRAAREFPGGQRARQVIYAGVDVDRYRPGLQPRDRRVLFVGRLLPHKGINYLIEAVDGTIPLTVAGRPYHPEYFQLLRRLAHGKDVTFITDAGDDDILRLYRTSAVSVLPSVCHTADGGYTPVPELLGFTLMEAMACATPVICTQTGSLPEVVTDGVDGFVVPPNDPGALRERIVALLDDPIRARAMGDQARQTIARRFTWQGVVDRCLTAYAGGRA
jgi:glycosyltransferase involved in cell wall biosynthesis